MVLILSLSKDEDHARKWSGRKEKAADANVGGPKMIE